MPARSEKQRKAACATLGRKRKGKSSKGRPFSGATEKQLRDFCKKKR